MTKQPPIPASTTANAPTSAPVGTPTSALASPLNLPLEWRVENTLMEYDQALAIMEARAHAIRAGTAGEMIWLLEHPSVYTTGRAPNTSPAPSSPDAIIRETGRGGEWTWHGPGQRVVYIMLDVAARGGDVRLFVRQVEEWAILALGTLGLKAFRRDGYPGVWTQHKNAKPDKIAAIGIRLTKWVSWHGMAINLDPDLGAFDDIIPCGVEDGGVTSLTREGIGANMTDLDAALADSFNAAFPPSGPLS